MLSKRWEGARWWKCDLHAHTPASDDYGKGPDQESLKNRSPREWLLDYMRAGIDCVAVTDHNSGAWINHLKSDLDELGHEQPEGHRDLYLFPGIEISVHGGVHLLALLAIEATTSDIDNLRGAVGLRGAPGISGDVTTKSFVDVVNEIIRAGGIAIPAHVDGRSGLFTQGVGGDTLKQALSCSGVFAMETMASDYSPPQSYHDKKIRWTNILGSDSHHPLGRAGQRFPGSHFTWVKMGVPNLDGLRLALRDGSLSVRRSDDCPGNPNQHASSMIDSIEVSAAKYIGRKEPFIAKLNPWLNAIIGGRGTGKSTLVECLRIALRRNDELPDDLKADFEKYAAVQETRDDTGLLTKEAAIRVVYRKDESTYRIQWSPTGGLAAIEEYKNKEWSQAQGEIRQRFPIRMFSQKQIFQLAKTPGALLTIVDDAREVDRRSWDQRWRKEETNYLSSRLKTRKIENEILEEPRLRGELDDVMRKLAVSEQSGQGGVLRTFQRRCRQKRAIEAWEKTWDGVGDRLRGLGANILPDVLDDAHMDTASQTDPPLLAQAVIATDRLEVIRKQLDEIAAEADRILSDWRMDLSESAWKQAYDAAAAAYNAQREKLEAEGVGDPSTYGELVQRRQMIEQRLELIENRKREVLTLKARQTASLGRLLDLRRELTDARRSFLSRILSDNRYVRIRVIPYGGHETAEADFRDLLQRTDRSFERDIGAPGGEGLLGRIYPEVGGLLGRINQSTQDGRNIEGELNEVKKLLRSVAEGSNASGMVADQRFAVHLRRLPPEAFDRADVWFPEDSLDVQYSPTGDSRNFRSIKDGSPGQMTAALLAFLLSYGDEPLILDQPEDDLDNQLIHELIVKQVRDIKQNRQIIVVTHNPNIVVNGDAELVLALSARGGATRIECKGSLQQQRVRETVCAIMEGGRDAFEERFRRIAGEEFGVR